MIFAVTISREEGIDDATMEAVGKLLNAEVEGCDDFADDEKELPVSVHYVVNMTVAQLLAAIKTLLMDWGLMVTVCEGS